MRPNGERPLALRLTHIGCEAYLTIQLSHHVLGSNQNIAETNTTHGYAITVHARRDGDFHNAARSGEN